MRHLSARFERARLRSLALSGSIVIAGAFLLAAPACDFPEYGFAAGGAGSGGGTGGGPGPQCSSDEDCGATPQSPLCDPNLLRCVECLVENDTCGEGKYCSTGGTCEPGCDDDDDCNTTAEGDLPPLTCAGKTHQCLGCVIVGDADNCPEDLICDNGLCVLPCGPGTGDCSDEPGCETQLTTLTDCGACGAECANFHGTTACDGGCIPACDPLYADCDSNPNNGCETSLESVTDCGGCTVSCEFPHATPACASGVCAVADCEQGWGDCDGEASNGCETDTTTTNAHCGGCNSPCSGGDICANGSCQSTCPSPTADCDMSSSTGCEVDTSSDGLHCGNCPNSCSTSQYCQGGSCASCAGALRDCDRLGSNGCETNSAIDPLNCGGCGTSCGSDSTCACNSSACSGGTIYLSEDFSDNSRGWQLGAEWSIAPATAGTGQQQGQPDPANDHTPSADDGIAGVNIGGNYTAPPHDFYYMTSPVINLSGASGTVNLTYWRWLNCDWSPFTTHLVEVFNGTSWVTVWSNASVGNNLIVENTWSRWTHDVTAYKNAQFRVRFGYRTDKQGAFLAWVMSGWNIDDLTLSSGTCQ